MKHFTKTLVAAALFASAGAANASIATGTSAELYMQVYDQTQGLTFDLDLGSNSNATLPNMINAVANKLSLHYDLSNDANWKTFTGAGFDAAHTKFGVVVGNLTKWMTTSNNPNPLFPSAGSNFTAVASAIKTQAGQINSGLTANTALNVSKLVSDAAPAKTGQWAAAAAGQAPLTTLYTAFANADAAINYGATGNFFYEVSAGGAVAISKLGTWTLSGNSLDFHYNAPTPAAVPLPAAVWMFGAGLMGMLRLSRRKSAAV